MVVEEEAAAAAAAAAEDAEETGSTNQKNRSSKGCMKKNYLIESPHNKRKPQYELSDPRLSSLKCKFRDRLNYRDDESAKTESLGCDGIFVDKICDTYMVNRVEQSESCDNTQSLFGGCIEVDSINGIESQKVVRASSSSSSSNDISSDTFSSSRSRGTKDTDSWVVQHLGDDHPGLMLLPYDDEIEMIYDVHVLGRYNDLMNNGLASGDVDGSAACIMDEELYSNGIDDLLILPRGQNGCHGGKKELTIDQEFEEYFSNLML